MTEIDFSTMSLEEAMEHYGVKGMRWGKRSTKPTSADVHNARRRVGSTINTLDRKAVQLSGAKTKADKQAILKDIKSIANSARKSGDTSVASRMTRGEKVATALSVVAFTPAGGAAYGVTVKAINKAGANQANKILEAYGSSKLSDYYSE